MKKLAAEVVSIRSPHKSKGRPPEYEDCGSDQEFQSAPLTKARGDSAAAPHIRQSPGFNPLPSQKQGETEGRYCNHQRPAVSIRSPHKSKGRRIRAFSCFRWMSFQSAPLTKARGDYRSATYTYLYKSFNPLPSQKQGETGRPRSLGAYFLCFNPLPSQKQGETNQRPGAALVPGVSIRSPHKSKGRLQDFGAAVDVQGGFNPLPSQKQGETWQVARTCGPATVSIRSPHKSKGRQLRLCARRGGRDVSIRSPHKSKGRPMTPSRSAWGSKFQSAPLTKARGDKEKDIMAIPLIKFQSAPLTKARGDTPSYKPVRSFQCFNDAWRRWAW